MQRSQPFLASSVAEQCRQLSQSLPHVVLNVPCIKAERELGQPMVAALIYFTGWSYLQTIQKNNMFQENISLHFFFLLVQKGVEEDLIFSFLFALNYFLSFLNLNDLF